MFVLHHTSDDACRRIIDRLLETSQPPVPNGAGTKPYQPGNLQAATAAVA